MNYLYHSVQDSMNLVRYDREDRKIEYEKYLNVSFDTFKKQVGKFNRNEDIVTFDDGYSNNMEPSRWLYKNGYTGMVFVSTAFMGKEFRHCSLMVTDPCSLKEMSEMVEIGSHGVNHLDLVKLDDATLMYELTASRKTLSYILGKEVTILSYPYGKFDDRVKRAAKGAGYKKACGTWIGELDKDEFSISRRGVCTEGAMK